MPLIQFTDEVVPVATGNHTMSEAINQARASISEFFKAFNNPQPNQTDFLIKACFEEGDEVEHIWLSDLDFKTRIATGVVANEPCIRTLSYLERVQFLPDQITDWMYREDRRLVGGFTTKVLLRAKLKQGGLQALLERLRPM
jgi:uncharacterized protein YegJ (DUF2314 family)